MVEASRTPLVSSTQWKPSAAFLRAVSVGSGAVAVAIVLAGFGSPIVLGALTVPWILCGRALYSDSAGTSQGARLVSNVLFWSAAVAALTVLSELYMLALGPSWKL